MIVKTVDSRWLGLPDGSFGYTDVHIYIWSGLKTYSKCLTIFSFCQGLKREKRLLPAYLKNDGCHGRGWSHQQRDKRGFSRESKRSSMKIRNRIGPRTLPWGTPAFKGRGEERIPFRAIRWLRE